MIDTESRAAGYFLLLLAISFTGWNFFQELALPDIQYSDVALHLSILKMLDRVALAGENILDFWYDGVPYGFALFRSYQYLPYLLMYGIYLACGNALTLAQILIGSIWILSLLLPASVFWSLRAVGLRHLEAGIAAALSVLIADGSEYGMGLQNYTFGTIGIITQLWALVSLFPAICLGSQYILHRRGLGGALIFSFLTFGSHVIAAVILLVCLSCFALGKCWSSRRFPREFLVLVSLLAAVTAHQWIFVLLDSPYINRSLLEPGWKYAGRGVSYAVNLLWSGGIFDHARFPTLTILIYPTLMYCTLFRRELRAESGCDFLLFLPGLFVLFFSLYCGRDVWGWLFNALPVFDSLHMHRFAIGVHMFGIIIIATGLGHLIRLAAPHQPRQLLLVSALLLFLKPTIDERTKMYSESHSRQEISATFVEQDKDLKQLLNLLQESPYGWTYIGSNTTWQGDLKIAGFLPLDLLTMMNGTPTVGGILFHAFSLAGETLFDFNPKNESHFDLFGIRNIVAPSSWTGNSKFSLRGSFGRYAFWSRDSHMLYVADDRFNAHQNLSGQTNLARSFVQQSMKIDGSAGVVVNQRMYQPWTFSGTAVMKAAGKVVGAVGYHPNWEVLVDGQKTQTAWVLPGLTMIEVPAGQHEIVFYYRGNTYKKYLLMVSGLILLLTLWFNTYPTKIRPSGSNGRA